MCAVLLPTGSYAQENKYRLPGLKNRIAEDSTYRNRFIAGSLFTGILLLVGLYVLSKPNQPGPRPRSG
ncbi:MAG: hypothetical protein AAB701_02100 [Patescibacteria group bacterium]